MLHGTTGDLMAVSVKSAVMGTELNCKCTSVNYTMKGNKMTYEKPSIWEITRGFVIGLLVAVGVILVGLIIQRGLSLRTVERTSPRELCSVPYRCDGVYRAQQ